MSGLPFLWVKLKSQPTKVVAVVVVVGVIVFLVIIVGHQNRGNNK